MERSARSRSVLVVAPIGFALLFLAGAGLLRPHWIDPGPTTPTYLVAVILVGMISTVLLARAAVRSPRAPSASWGSVAAASGLGTVFTLGLLLHWPDPLTWGVLRIGILVALIAGVMFGAGHRAPQDWGLLLLDGWLVAVSVFMIGWVAVSLTGSPLADAPPGLQHALYWLPADVLIASITTGIAMRTTPIHRTPVLLVVLAGLLGVVTDTAWGLTGVPYFGVIAWMISTTALAGSTLIGPLDLWTATVPSRAHPPLLRLPQWAVVPGLITAVIDVRDPVVMGAAVSVILGLAAELAMAGRQNQALWDALHQQAERLDQLLSESRDAIVHVDGNGVIRFANEALVDVLGFLPQEVLELDGLNLVHPSDRDRLVSEITVLGDGELGGGMIRGRFQHADGTWRSLEATVSRRSGGEPGYTLSARDISERVTLEAELRRLAGTDALTGLLNRPAFLEVLEERVKARPATVLFVDLDGFKAVNDMDGHAAGDRLLREVAETLRRELRGPDVAARLGGDEFAVLLGTDQLTEARAVADRLVQRLRRMPSDPGRRTAASVGVATGRDVVAEGLLGDADLAMYEAKARGGRRHVVFEPWMRERVTERARMGAALQRACEGEGLLLDVQPIVAMSEGRWVGFEALARWQDGPHRREPHEFLPVAEESGLIDPLGRWVLHRSLSWLARWPDRRAGISVNVAGSQLATVGFGDWVHQQLAGCGVAPARLTLEISERTALGDLQRATAVLQPLRALGVRIALDDFGTGFSSLGHLADMPVDELKIDKRFVAGLGRRAQDDALVRAVCQLAADLRLTVVAEGVETPAQENTLLEHGCQLGQGFRFLPPTSIADLRLPTARRPPSALAGPRSSGWPPDGRIAAS
jgi:diguanylate cyclase (GGDEF)-like protein/PAS domain S-box-containing protein